MSQLWKVEDKNITIDLIHEDDFSKIPDGTVLYDIFGEKFVKGVDKIDDDTRGGYMAFGTLVEAHDGK